MTGREVFCIEPNVVLSGLLCFVDQRGQLFAGGIENFHNDLPRCLQLVGNYCGLCERVGVILLQPDGGRSLGIFAQATYNWIEQQAQEIVFTVGAPGNEVRTVSAFHNGPVELYLPESSIVFQ